MNSSSMSRGSDDRSRTDELLCDRAVFGLTDDEHRELASLPFSDSDLLAHEQTAAVYYLAAASLELKAMPDRLRSRVRELPMPGVESAGDFPTGGVGVGRKPPAARAVARGQHTVGQGERGVASSWRAVFPWVMALAASLLVGVWLGRVATVVSENPTPAVALQALLAEPDAKQLEWVAVGQGQDPGDVTGSVVWSDRQQEGYMVFRGMKPNDPSVEQYQLWVFDSERDARYPVDGGVFDIVAGREEVVVPINTKIPVNNAVMFAVTVEKPGGVVVSDRERLPLLAKVEGAS